MPIIPSAKKRMRQNAKRRARNKARRTRMRQAVRSLLSHIEAGDVEAARAQWQETQSIIDVTARKGVIHPNKAARTKSRLSRRLQELAS